jgi:esterase/lipase superfamily enzyme
MPLERSASRVFGAAVCLLLAGCAPRGSVTFDSAAAEIGTVETILVSTARQEVDVQPIFTRARAENPTFALFQISVPPDRQVGTVTFPRRQPPDPRTDFLTVSALRLAGEVDFIRHIDQQLAVNDQRAGRAAIFVHGFNTNFAEGLYRQAQLQYDYGRHPASIHFSWPSSAKATEYVYDRESALFSRDALETTLAAMARSNAAQINVLAHSMGAQLTMDTLMIMARIGHDDFFRKLNAILLISPDIEIDVFRKQAPPVLAHGTPIFIVVSTRDRALELSALIRGERERLGTIHSPADLGGLDVTVIDLSDVESGGGLGHFALARSPELIEMLRGMPESGLDVLEHQQRGLVGNTVQLIQQGTDILFSPVAP